MSVVCMYIILYLATHTYKFNTLKESRYFENIQI